jgi:hypothetical protein
MEKLAISLGGVLDTATVLREFLKSKSRHPAPALLGGGEAGQDHSSLLFFPLPTTVRPLGGCGFRLSVQRAREWGANLRCYLGLSKFRLKDAERLRSYYDRPRDFPPTVFPMRKDGVQVFRLATPQRWPPVDPNRGQLPDFHQNGDGVGHRTNVLNESDSTSCKAGTPLKFSTVFVGARTA